MSAHSRKAPEILSIGVYVFIGILLLSIFANILATNSRPFEIALKQVDVKEQMRSVSPTEAAPKHINRTTVLSFVPDSSLQSPLSRKVGDVVTFEVLVAPGQNLVSFVKTEILYDATKLTPEGTDFFIADNSMPSILEGPTNTPGKINVTLSIGPNPQNALDAPTRIATLKFRAIGATSPKTPTAVTFGGATQVLSLEPNDNAADNVLLDTRPAVFTIK